MSKSAKNEKTIKIKCINKYIKRKGHFKIQYEYN